MDIFKGEGGSFIVFCKNVLISYAPADRVCRIYPRGATPISKCPAVCVRGLKMDPFRMTPSGAKLTHNMNGPFP